MRKATTILYLFFLLSATIIGTNVLPSVRAATGLVCIADPSLNPSSCPSNSATFSGAVGSMLTIAVNIQGSDSFNAFDIRIQADSTVINGTSISIAGTVLTNIVVNDECVNGVFMAGACQPSPGTVEVILAASSSTTAPTTGRLFSVTYNVVGTSSTPITYPTGCTSSSVSGTTTCVAINNGGAVVSETAQTGSFTGPPTPDFSISANPSSLTITQGSTGSSTITLTSLNGFTGTVTLSVTVTPPGPTASLSPPIIGIPTGGSNSSTLTVATMSSTPTGMYNVAVSGSSGSLSHSTIVSVRITSPPPPPDFSLSSGPSSLTITKGSSATVTVSATSLQGFSGAINLSLSISPNTRRGPGLSLAQSTLTLTAGGTSSTSLVISTNGGTLTGTYTITITGQSGSIIHTTTVTVTIIAKH